ncbi:uncharacterized protein P884DRAFT_277731 [Thermothelomyces heterothallicus CBS 202.75]|uniref:uncharacterized protein n=1 Tax=Thermothelomyces heterothallicus CBS 202.75 TaxID=1149848 RepID=UPI00374305C3
MEQRAQIIRAPSRPAITEKVAVFLAGITIGTTTAAAAAAAGADRRETVTRAVSHLPVTRADLVVVYLGPGTDAPRSLLEPGLCARSGKAVVVACHPGYRKRGNVQIMCRRFGLEYVDGEDDLAGRVVKRIERLLELGN